MMQQHEKEEALHLGWQQQQHKSRHPVAVAAMVDLDEPPATAEGKAPDLELVILIEDQQ